MLLWHFWHHFFWRYSM